MKTVIGLLLCVVAPIPCLAADQPAADESDAPIRDFDLKTLESLGRRIFEHDQCAARATDILIDTVGPPDELHRQAIRGWIVVQREKTVVVRFGKVRDGQIVPAYDITFDRPRHGTLKKADNKAFPPDELARFRAVRLALDNIPKLYTENYNSVLLPDPQGKGFLVYALAATMEPDQVVFGGHYRFTISETGEKIERIDRLSKSFLSVSKTPKPDSEHKSVGLIVTHLVSATPIETHVFLGLLHKLPVYVTTPDGKVWRVDDGHIVEVKDLPTATEPKRDQPTAAPQTPRS